MRWFFVFILVLACALGPRAEATRLAIHIADTGNQPVADAVVELTGGPVAAAVAPGAAVHVIDQRNETFVPYVEVIRPGEQVVFRNSDKTRHQVYSFSEVKRFEYVLRPGETSPPMTIDKTGIAAIGCNIHDEMITYLYVTSAQAVKVSDGKGEVDFDDVAPGSYTVNVWHPQLRPGDTGQHRAVDVTTTPMTSDFKLVLLADPRTSMDREHMGY
jgi:plastocyanin